MTVLIVFGVIALVGIVAVLWAIGVYNGLIKLRNQMKNALAQIDVQLKRRYDLIPNLVETAKAYMKHEQETLTAVIAARNQGLAAMKALSADATDPAAFKSLMQAEGSLGGLLKGLSVTMEAYPDLKANTTMNGLLEELTSTENKVSFARQAYNDAVLVYNNAREIFPASLISGTFQFAAGILFEVENASERQAVKVQF
jgi:LemA protein